MPDPPAPSTGHVAEVPEQFSATSQTPIEGRHTVVDGAKPLVGQVDDVPLQTSGTSHAPAAARHSVPFGWTASAGHPAEDPEQ